MFRRFPFRLILTSVGLLLRGGLGFGDEIPQGEVAKYQFEGSKIFPGTVRDYWVYVPQQYDPARPACLWVNQDGLQFNAPKVFDELIHKKEMPVTIGVFIMHGRVKAPSDQALDRFNRSYEYDGLGDDYARFLLEELLPEVEKKTTKDGRAIRFSKDPNDRGIGGSSSGAICAFTAAWERPDSFHRVFSSIGTYVGLRGGNEYATLVRKTEPKPIRIFLQDGENDLNIYGGDWWMANQEMERALTFAGYEVNHAWGKGGHNHKEADVVFPDAQRWLWKDWPAPVKAGAGSQPLQAILEPGEGWTIAADGLSNPHALAASPTGDLLFADGGKIFKLGRDGQPTALPFDAPDVSSLASGPDGRLYAASPSTKAIQVWDAAGKATVINLPFQPRSLLVKHDGSLYVTSREEASDSGKVYRIADGEARLVDDGGYFADALAFSTDQSLLYLTSPRTRWVTSAQFDSSGATAQRQNYYHLHIPDDDFGSGASALQVDRQGLLYVATRMGVQVCDQPGRVNCIIPVPGGVATSLSFGGEDGSTLYVAANGKIYQRKLKAKGAHAFQAPTKPETPHL